MAAIDEARVCAAFAPKTGRANSGEARVLLYMKRLDPEFRKKWGYE